MERGTACLVDGGAPRVDPLATPGLALRTLPTAIRGSLVLALDEGAHDAPQREFLHLALQTPDPLSRSEFQLALTDPDPGISPEAFPGLSAPVGGADRLSRRPGGGLTRMIILRGAAAGAAGLEGRVRP